MSGSQFPTIDRWLAWRGSLWRLSTWWPSDTQETMQRSLLRLLAVAHRERLEVAPLVANLADEHRGRYRRRLRRLARRLSDGTPLIDALEQTPDSLRDEDVLALRLASQTGTLGATYASLVDESSPLAEQALAIRRHTFAYFVIMLLIVLLAVMFLVSFIVPVLKYMHDDFGLVEMSGFFQAFLSVAQWVTNYAPLLILLVVAFAFLVWAMPSRRFFRRVLAGRFFRGVAQARSCQLLQLLATTVEAGRPLPAAISTLARYHFDRGFRQRLLFARNEIEQGADVWTSLADCRLLTPEESRAIGQCSSNESQAWSMRQLANWKLDQISSRRTTRLRFVQPVITILFAGLVLLIGGAMIGFLAQMVHSLGKMV